MAIQAGKAAPGFTLADADGRRVSLGDFAGRHVILYFYPKDDTPGCTKEACGFRDLRQEIEKQGAVVLGVSADSPASHGKFRAKHGLPFPLLSDPEREVMTCYGAWGEKVLYGKKTVGVIRSTVWIGPDGKVRRHWARVANAAEHPARVLDALREDGSAAPETARAPRKSATARSASAARSTTSARKTASAARSTSRTATRRGPAKQRGTVKKRKRR